MRDLFGYVFRVPQQETKTENNDQDKNFTGMYVSTNGYYGYQPLPQNHQKQEENSEYMDVQTCDCGIQFNNFIPLQDRLSDPREVNGIRGLVNRKRRYSDDTPLVDFKKRRENEYFHPLTTANKNINSRQPTHNVPDMPRSLMGHFI